jgi:hypothetical protein
MFLLAAMFCLAACDRSPTSPVAQALNSEFDTTAAALAAAKKLWATSAPRNYQYTVELGCFCAGLVGPVVVTVIDGKVVRREIVRARIREDLGDHSSSRIDQLAPSVEDLFRTLDEVRQSQPGIAYAIYHPTRGYPLVVYLDYQPGAADDELGFSISDLRPIRPPQDLWSRRER